MGNFSSIYPEPDTRKISSKTDALTYAISVTRTADGLHLDKAEQVFRMFLDNIELPNVAEEPKDNFYAKSADAMQVLSVALQRMVAHEIEKSEQVDKATTETVTEPEATVEVEKKE